MRARGCIGVVLTLVVTAACGGSSAPQRSTEPPRCGAGLKVPDGFEVTGSIEDPSKGHTGVRLDLKAGDGSELHYFSGIQGEFGEGLPDQGDVKLADGSKGRLAGDDSTWILQWDDGTACAPTVVLGTGMDATTFREVAREAGALPAR